MLKDLKLKYRDSALGFRWSLANPLSLIVVYSFVFMHMLRVDVANFPYFLITLPPGAYAADVSGVQLIASEVSSILQGAAASFSNSNMTVAVVDRPGNILGIFRKPGAGGGDDNLAVSLARTGAFFSNNQAPLSSRTVRFISGIHFPPGISFTPNAALYGIENTNRGCDFNVAFNAGKEVPQPKSVNGFPCNSSNQSGCGLGITTGKADLFDSNPNAVNPGGVPIFRGSVVVGGIGVVIKDSAGNLLPNHAEFATLAGTAGFPPTVASPGEVFIDGIRLPFVEQTTRPGGTVPDVSPPPGTTVIGPFAGVSAPDGYLVGPVAGSSLTAAEVDQIVQAAVSTANITRAAIRLPPGNPTKMVIAVGDVDGTILALFRMADSTIFSIDVAVAKARNVVYFSSLDPNVALDLPGVPLGTAVTNRTISFGSQPLYPPGIDGTSPGPFFDLFLRDTQNVCSQGSQAANPNQNGIVFFPGSIPLYKNGQLAGGLGVSGDGVEQDDFVTSGGATGFVPDSSIQADQIFVQGVRLPFLKFPRNPTLETGGGGGGCFIATAAFGSPMAEEVRTLRQFRDRFLLTNDPGKAFVYVYYTLSPPFAELIRQREVLRAATRAVLQPVIWWAQLALVSPGMALLVAMSGFGVGSLISFVAVRGCRVRAARWQRGPTP